MIRFCSTARGVGLASALTFAGSAGAVLVDFNDPADVNLFSPIKTSDYNSSGGVGDSGTMNFANSSGNMVTYTGETFDLSTPGSMAIVSADFQNKGTGASNSRSANLGLTTDAEGSLLAGARLQAVSPQHNYQLRVRFDTPDMTNVQNGPAVTLVDNFWYRLVATINHTSAGSGFVVAELFDLGEDGLSTPMLVDSFTSVEATAANNLFSDTTLYAGYTAEGDFRGIRKVDNFRAVIPEPASLAVLAVGMAWTGLRRRRSNV